MLSSCCAQHQLYWFEVGFYGTRSIWRQGAQSLLWSLGWRLSPRWYWCYCTGSCCLKGDDLGLPCFVTFVASYFCEYAGRTGVVDEKGLLSCMRTRGDVPRAMLWYTTVVWVSSRATTILYLLVEEPGKIAHRQRATKNLDPLVAFVSIYLTAIDSVLL